eukprot:772721_1
MTSLATEAHSNTDDQSQTVSSRAVKIWPNTTHRYLYDPSSTLIDKIIAIVTVLTQLVIYAGITYLAMQQDNHVVNVTANLHDTRASEGGMCVGDAGLTLDDLFCETDKVILRFKPLTLEFFENG